jgi:hypothetical protein
MRNIGIIVLTTLFVSLFTLSATKDEGMFPLNYLDEKALQNAGLKLSTRELFSPGEVSLANALVKVGGCHHYKPSLRIRWGCRFKHC